MFYIIIFHISKLSIWKKYEKYAPRGVHFFPSLKFNSIIPYMYVQSRGISEVFLVCDGSVKSIENGVPMVRMS